MARDGGGKRRGRRMTDEGRAVRGLATGGKRELLFLPERRTDRKTGERRMEELLRKKTSLYIFALKRLAQAL